MGFLAGFNGTESEPTVTTTASLLLAGADVGPHTVVVTNVGGMTTVWVKFAPTLSAANATDGVNFWLPIASGETAAFHLSDGGLESSVYVRGGVTSQGQIVLAKRIPRGD